MRGWTLTALIGALLCSACGGGDVPPSGTSAATRADREAVMRVHPVRPIPPLAPLNPNASWPDLLFTPPPPRALAWSASLTSAGTAPGDLELRGLAGIRDRVALVGRSSAEVLLGGQPVVADRGQGSSFIIALDRKGTFAWARRSDISYVRARESSGSELLVAGTAPDGDVVVQRWGADGNLLREYRWDCRAEIASLSASPDNGFILAANLREPCAPAGEYLDKGALIVGVRRNGHSFLEFWKDREVIDLDAMPSGDVMVARSNRAGAHELLRLGPDGRIRWSTGLSPQRAVRVSVDPLGRTFLASDVELRAWSPTGTVRWRSPDAAVTSLTSGRGWVARTEAGPSATVLTMADGRDGEVLLQWTDALLSAGQVAATANGDALVSVSSLYELAWEDGHLTARGQPGSPRITIVRLQADSGL